MNIYQAFALLLTDVKLELRNSQRGGSRNRFCTLQILIFPSAIWRNSPPPLETHIGISEFLHVGDYVNAYIYF